jgi:hypothetical protein
MPGRRNLARERAAHDADQKFREFHALLSTQLPAHDRAVLGRSAVLTALHALGVRRLNGRPITVRMLRRWRHHAGFPMLPGSLELGRHGQAALPTHFALVAWLLSRGAHHRLFRVVFTRSHAGEASPQCASHTPPYVAA